MGVHARTAAAITVRSVDVESVWFSDAEPRNDAEAGYLATLRELVSGWDVAGLRPEHTSVLTVLTPLHLTVELAGLPGDITLQVGYWQTDPYGPGLEGEWGDDHLLDSHVNGVDGLAVQGLAASPDQFATWTAEWLLAQLRRPVERLEWLGCDGAVVATRWRLPDTGHVLKRQGRPFVSRRPPDRALQVR